jgi:hypothetical protein
LWFYLLSVALYVLMFRLDAVFCNLPSCAVFTWFRLKNQLQSDQWLGIIMLQCYNPVNDSVAFTNLLRCGSDLVDIVGGVGSVWLMSCVFGFSWYLILCPFSNLLRFARFFLSRWWFQNLLRFACFFISDWPLPRQCWLFGGSLRAKPYLPRFSFYCTPPTFDSWSYFVDSDGLITFDSRSRVSV